MGGETGGEVGIADDGDAVVGHNFIGLGKFAVAALFRCEVDNDAEGKQEGDISVKPGLCIGPNDCSINQRCHMVQYRTIYCSPHGCNTRRIFLYKVHISIQNACVQYYTVPKKETYNWGVILLRRTIPCAA